VSVEFQGTERFEVVRLLGAGGFGLVYEAVDHSSGRRVALKVPRHPEGDPLVRFKREFRSLANIRHRNLVALYELLEQAGQWFFTMELVQGQTLLAHVRPSADPRQGTAGPPLFDESRLRADFRQLAEALATLHDHGLVHCDVKPSNVLVTNEGRLVVLDFGLIAERHNADEPDDDVPLLEELTVFGTPAYMAPERTSRERVTPAADWYSVGVLLYEALTGRVPFQGSALDVLDAKELDAPLPVWNFAPRAPRDLAALALALLHPEPSHRPSERDVLRLLGGSSERTPLPSLSALGEPLLGRKLHEVRLRQAYEETTRDSTKVVFVSGPSGIGKSALIRSFVRLLQRTTEALVLESRCDERETMPYKALDPLVDALTEHLRKLRDIEAARLMPADVAMLARAFPTLRAVDEIRRAPGLSNEVTDSLVVRQRAAGALRDLCFRLRLHRPLVLIIDDAQWGDIDSATILGQIVMPPHAPPLLIIVAYRSEDADADFLARFRVALQDLEPGQIDEVGVEALAADDARALAERLIRGRAPALDAEHIARESRGSPFFIYQLAEHAAATRQPSSLSEVLEDRIRALDHNSQQLLTAIALSAQAMPAAVAVRAAQVDESGGDSLQILRAARLVRVPSQGATVDVYHDRIRETIVARLSPAYAQVWHQHLAAVWEAAGDARPETLVTHYVASNTPEKARPYAALAAQRAEETLAFERAAEFYKLLVSLETDASQRAVWLRRRGEALVNSGRGYEAARVFLEALDVSPHGDSIELERRAASEFIRAGYLDEANDVLLRLLPRVGARAPRTDAAALARLIWYRTLIRLRGTGFRERTEDEIGEATLRRIDVLMSVAQPLALVALARGNALNFQASWLALRAGERRRVAAGVAGLAASSGMSGTRTTAHSLRLAEQAHRLAAPLQDPTAAARAVLAEGMILKVNGKWQEGAATLQRAIDALTNCTGVRWEIETAQTLRHDALYWMGAWNQLARELPTRRQEAIQRGDLYSGTHVTARLGPIVRMAADRVEEARAEAESGLGQWTSRQYHLQHRWGVCTGIDLDLYSGNPVAAAERLFASWRALRAITFLFQNGRIEMLFYRARIALALAARSDAAASHIYAATRDARTLEKERAAWASALAALVRSCLAATVGDRGEATTRLEIAEGALRDCRMDHYAAAARYRRGQLMRGSQGEALMNEASAWFARENIQNPTALLNLLAPGPW
jgi:eukaryotic-like serine/threonine-protein kinase